jgi:hypothetical protein
LATNTHKPAPTNNSERIARPDALVIDFLSLLSVKDRPSGNTAMPSPRFTAILSVVLVCSGVPFCTNSPAAAIDSPNPFTDEQCTLAWNYASHRLRNDPTDARAHLTQAEALLCAGLRDNIEALDRAIAGFEEAVRREPANFYPRLYLAEALRKRFFLSDEAVQAFLAARDVLGNADVGAARSDYDAYIVAAVGEIRQQQDHFSLVLRDGEADFVAGRASPHQIGDWLKLLSCTGPGGLRQALSTLDTYLVARPNEILETFYRAELLRGIVAATKLVPLYRAAETALCAGDPDLLALQACGLARERLRRLTTDSPFNTALVTDEGSPR